MITLSSETATWTETDEGQVLILDLVASRYLSAEGSAAVLWRRLALGTTRDELVATLVAEFAIDGALASRDVDAFLADLRSRDMLIEG